jgi:hypothetical protein
MPLMGFELTIPVFEQPKIFNVLDRAVTVIGYTGYWSQIITYSLTFERKCSFIKFCCRSCFVMITRHKEGTDLLPHSAQPFLDSVSDIIVCYLLL